MLWGRSDYPGIKRNYYASVKKNTTKILLFSNILKQINSTKSRIILIALELDNKVQILHDLYMKVQILHLFRMRGAK